ncbi:MAG: 16S rRNA (adenine(1518)-N(6)/adenine(1519)-N(6))-dimethyltransferase RsmA [Gammaproteobacteria bacterium]|nr:16S rRNA (adenine(1518)-N(6)/adenine(1519)-N(6))-dimethyltransferase RsmA [Gammaproteobacteria bacterium]
MCPEPIHRPRKRFGQNFLHDRFYIERILTEFEVDPKQDIIEIGPGKGALTIPLLKKYGHLHVIEIDRELAQHLEDKCADLGELHLHLGDALKLDVSTLVTEGKLQICGNLPYNISTPLIFHLLKTIPDGSLMLFMLQNEVVDRICASHNHSDYGRLSVMVQAQCRVEKLFEVPSEAFSPQPKVTSAVVKIQTDKTRRKKLADPKVFEQVVRQAFGQRRKTLRNALKKLLLAHDLSEVSVDSSSRAENISVEQFIAIANMLSKP